MTFKHSLKNWEELASRHRELTETLQKTNWRVWYKRQLVDLKCKVMNWLFYSNVPSNLWSRCILSKITVMKIIKKSLAASLMDSCKSREVVRRSSVKNVWYSFYLRIVNGFKAVNCSEVYLETFLLKATPGWIWQKGQAKSRQHLEAKYFLCENILVFIHLIIQK